MCNPHGDNVMTARALTRRRIVTAIDGASLSARVIALATAAAPMFDADVEALHVIKAQPAASQARQIRRGRRRGLPRTHRTGAAGTREVLDGAGCCGRRRRRFVRTPR